MKADKQKKIRKTIAVIGSGNMAEAFISGLVQSGLADKRNIISTDVRPERLRYMRKKYGISVETGNDRAAAKADIVFLAIKPQQMEPCLAALSGTFRKSQLVISIAAGVTTAYIEKQLPAGTAVVRAMPNTPAFIREGAVGIAGGRAARKSHMALAKKLFSTVGVVAELPEASINAVTALSGSGPAYVFYLCEAMEKAGIEMGLPEGVAKLLARQTIKGAGKMLSVTDTPAAELRQNVTSPGGTTEAALKYMESRELQETIVTALQRAQQRAGELSR